MSLNRQLSTAKMRKKTLLTHNLTEKSITMDVPRILYRGFNGVEKMWNLDEELIAQQFFEHYLADEPFPLDLKHIALAVEKELAVEVFFQECELPAEITAQLRKGNYAALIYVNRDHDLTRKRFAVVHEFGHLLLKHRNGIPCPGLGESDKEFEAANNFASALLMPESPLVKKLNSDTESPAIVPTIAKYFGVSLDTAAKRMARFDDFPAFYGMVDTARQRLDWEYHSSSFPFDRDGLGIFLSEVFHSIKMHRRSMMFSDYRFSIRACCDDSRYLLTCTSSPSPVKHIQPLCAKETESRYTFLQTRTK